MHRKVDPALLPAAVARADAEDRAYDAAHVSAAEKQEVARALEIAHCFENFDERDAVRYIDPAAATLRAQHARIERLEAVNARLLEALEARAQVDQAYVRLAMSNADSQQHEHLLGQIEDAEDAAKEQARAAIEAAKEQQ